MNSNRPASSPHPAASSGEKGFIEGLSSDQIQGFFDSEGKLAIWPSRKRREKQLAVLRHLAESFELERRYSEREVNEVLKSRLAISDFVLVRRELFEAGLLDRTLDGREYWRLTSSAETA